MIGQTISHYRILAKLGEGGMGAVYKAEDVRLQREVALKFLRAESLGSEEHKRRFLHEARAAAALDHPHICGIYEIEESDGRLFMAMPLLAGESVDERVARGPLPLTQAVDIAIQTTEALEEAHRKGIVHRDIKAANVMVRDRDRNRVHATLMDFGLARLSQATKLTREGSALGTAAYMSPEQATGEEVDGRTDIWSLGVVLYEMVIGRPPFRADYEQALFYAILNEQPEAMTTLRTGVPMELERIVSKCLAKAADDRYPTAAGLLVDLHALRKDLAGDSRGRTAALTQMGVSVVESTPAAAKAADLPWYRRWMPLAWGFLACATIVPVAIVWTVRHSGPPQPRGWSWDVDGLQVRQITHEPGLAGTPSFSPDGRFLVYAADEQGSGDLDIWVQEISAGSRVRLTQHPSTDVYPSFSPDGSKVLFTSTRNGGGIYTVPALGGTPRPLVDQEGTARYSPDGKLIAFASGGGTLFVLPADGGEARELSPDFGEMHCFQWLPDGAGLVFQGERRGGETDWWTVGAQGGEPRSAGAREWIDSLAVKPACPGPFVDGGKAMITPAFSAGSVNLWRVGFDAGAREVTGKMERVTLAGGFNEYPAVAQDGRIAFSELDFEYDVWRLPLDHATGQPRGELEQITNTQMLELRPHVSRNGRYLTFVGFDFRRTDIFVIDLRTGAHRELTQDEAEERSATLSPDERVVAYRAKRDGDEAVWLVDRTGGLPRTLCDECGGPRVWLPNGRGLILEDGEPRQLYQVALDTGSRELLVARDEFEVSSPDVSPNGRWIAFTAKNREGTARNSVYVARMPASGQIPQQEWVALTPGEHGNDTPRFSPDSGRIYFTSDRDDFTCIWSIAFDQKTGRPVGEPQPVQHFHGIRQTLGDVGGSSLEVSVTANSLTMPLQAVSGNIWIIEPSAAAE